MSSTTFDFMEVVSKKSDMQIVYIHWGDEYEPVHNLEQEQLAKRLIDLGADAIIGHHPHVIQDIGLYKGAPIFYSLGNFIFDQYFSDEVQVGLAVELKIVNNSISYHLIPFDSTNTPGSPRVMSVDKKIQLFQTLAEKSSPEISQSIAENGTIIVTGTLASL